MGGRGASSGGGGGAGGAGGAGGDAASQAPHMTNVSGVRNGQQVTVKHPIYGQVRGTVTNHNGRNSFQLSNATSTRGGSVPANTIFTGGSLSNNP